MIRHLSYVFLVAALTNAASGWAESKQPVEAKARGTAGNPAEERVILTPKPPKEPCINGARIYGVRPGSPFLYRIPATGERPMQFAVRDLPEGLVVNPETGVIAGRIVEQAHRTYATTFAAENAHGRAERDFRIVVG